MSTQPPTIPLRAIDAVKRGDTIEAIKILRAATPLSLAAAKSLIDAYRRGEPVVLPHPPMATNAPRTAADAKHAVEQSAVADRMRKASGFGLAQAQDTMATSRFRDHPTGIGGRSPGEMPRTGPALRWLVVIALIGYLVYSYALRAFHG